MAKGNKNPSPTTRWKPGQSGNPKGMEPGARVPLVIQRLTTQQVQDVASLILENDVEALNALKQTKGVPTLKVMLASCVTTIIQEGNMNALNSLLDRLIGKPKESIQVTGHLSVFNPEQIRAAAVQYLKNKDNEG